MAKATGKDPTKNTYALLLQPDALLEFDEAPKSKSKKNAPVESTSSSDPAKPPGYIPTPAEKELERKKKEEEQKKLAAEKEAIKKKKAAENEQAATTTKKPEKLSREQWEQQNKQQKKLQQSNPTGNQQVGQSDDGFQPARPKQQQQQQQQPLQQSGQGQPGPDGANRGGRRNFQGGRGGGGRGGDGQGGQNFQGGRGGGEGGQGRRGQNFRGEGQGREGEGRRNDGQGGNFRGGRGGEGRRGGRRGGRVNFEEEPPARLEVNKNRDVNQRGQDLTQERPPRKRQNDRKSGRFVTQHKTVANNNNTGELQIQVEGDWATNAAPPLEASDTATGGEGWGDEGKAPVAETNPEDAVKNEGNTASTEVAEQTGDAEKKKDLPTKGFDDFLKEQIDKKKQLAELLASNNISSNRPAPRVVEKDEAGGKYFDVNKLQDTHVTKKKEEPKKKEEQAVKSKPQEKPQPEVNKKELQYKLQIFNFAAPRGGRRFNQDDDLFSDPPPRKQKQGDQPGQTQDNTNQEGQSETKDNATTAPDTNVDNGGDNNNQQQQREGGNRPRGQRRGGRQGGQGERRERGDREGGQGERRERGDREGGQGERRERGDRGERQGGQGERRERGDRSDRGQGGQGERQGGQGGRGGGGRGRGRRFDSSSRGGNSNRGSGGFIATGPEHWPELV